MAEEGIEIPVILNPDGSVKGLEVIARKLSELTGQAQKAGEALDKVGGGAGGGGGQAGRSGSAGGAAAPTSFFESRTGEFVQKVASAGLTFVERSLPMLLDPTKSKLETAIAGAPLAARLTAQGAAGAALGAAQTKLLGTGVEIPEELSRQIIQTAGVAAEEGVKKGLADLQHQVETARSGAQGVLLPLAQMGFAPDQGTVEEIINSFKKVAEREFALRKMISQSIDSAFTSGLDDSLTKQLNGVSQPDANSMIDKFVGGFSPAKAGGS